MDKLLKELNDIRRRAGLKPIKEFASGGAVSGGAIASTVAPVGGKKRKKKSKKKTETIFAMSSED